MYITIPKNPMKLRTQCIPHLIWMDSFHIMFVMFYFCNFMYNLINYTLPFSLWSASCFFFDTHSLGFGSKFFVTTKRRFGFVEFFVSKIITVSSISCRCFAISSCFVSSFCAVWFCISTTTWWFSRTKSFPWFKSSSRSIISLSSVRWCGWCFTDIDDKSCFGIDSHLCGNPHQCLVKVCFVEIERIWHKNEKKEMIKNLLSVRFVCV